MSVYGDQLDIPITEEASTFSKSFYIRNINTHEPMPVFSTVHSLGIPAAVFSDKEYCIKFMKEMENAYDLNLEVVPILSLWDFFILCAENGLCGVLFDNTIGITFFNRLTDLDRNLPTIMWMKFPHSQNTTKGFFFGRRGIVTTKLGTTVIWTNQKICKRSYFIKKSN